MVKICYLKICGDLNFIIYSVDIEAVGDNTLFCSKGSHHICQKCEGLVASLDSKILNSSKQYLGTVH